MPNKRSAYRRQQPHSSRTTIQTGPWWWAGVLFTAAAIALPVIASWLSPVPQGNAYFSASAMQLGKSFSRESLSLGVVIRVLELGLLAVLVLTPLGARWVGSWEQGRSEARAIVRLTTMVMVLSELLSLPANYYLGFVREHRWGLSVQPLGGWIKDYMLSFLIGWATNLLIILIVAWLIRRSPRRWWLATGMALTILGAVFTLLYPVLIDPLFVEREPMQDPQVLTMAQRLADSAGAKLDGVFLEKASLKTNRANAMVTGLGPTKRIIIWDTLLRDYPPEEVESVVAHELGHAVYRDVFWSWVGSSLAAIFGSWLVARILGTPQQAGGLSWTRASQPRVVVAALLLLSILSTVSAPVMNTVTRVVEARADLFALDITTNPQAFIQSEVRLALSNPSDYDPPKLLEWFRYTHPAAMNRIRAGERWVLQHR